MRKKEKLNLSMTNIEYIEVNDRKIVMKMIDDAELINLDYEYHIDGIIEKFYTETDIFDFRKMVSKIDAEGETTRIVGVFINIEKAVKIEINNVDDELYQIYYKTVSGVHYGSFINETELASLVFTSDRIKTIIDEKGL